jgi:hypothetical protein
LPAGSCILEFRERRRKGIGCRSELTLLFQHQPVQNGLVLLVLLEAHEVRPELALLAVPTVPENSRITSNGVFKRNSRMETRNTKDVRNSRD